MPRSFFLALLTISIFFSACQTKQASLSHSIQKNCEYYSLKSAQCKDIEQMVNQLEPYKVIFIGDHHSEDSLHQKTAELIMALSLSGTKVKLANEWFYPSDNQTLHEYVSKDINETEFIEKIQWKKRLKYYKFDSFRPMYQAIQKTYGKLYGINLSKEERKKISDQNISAMNEDERRFNTNLDINVSAHKNMLKPFFSHCHAPKPKETLQECTERMYKVQVAWDSKMALESYKLSKGLQENEKLIVFAGALHIQNDLGIPLRFARLSNLPYVSIIPAEQTIQHIKHGLADFLMFYKEKNISKD